MKYTITLLVLLSNIISAQVKGVVKDSISGKPIPYVGIWSSNGDFATTSDKKGHFKIDSVSENDTLIFSTSAFELKKVSGNKLRKEVVLLSKKEILSKETMKFSGKSTKIIDDTINYYGAKEYYSIEKSTACMLARYIPYEAKYGEKHYLETLTLGMKSETKEGKIKLRFFEADATGNPGNEILQEEIVLKAPIFTYNFKETKNPNFQNDQFKINLKKHQLKVPRSGIFIAFELLLIEENKVSVSGQSGTSFEFYNPFILLSNEKTNDLWEFSKGKWNPKPNSKNIALKLTLTN